MRILFISKHFPYDLQTSVHGVYKRMELFIEAIKAFAALDMLFYVPQDQSYSQSQISDIEESFSKHWNMDIKLFLCPMSEFNDKAESSKWLSFGAGVMNFHRQKGYYELSGQKQVEALEKCLERQPSAIFAHRLSSMCPLLLTKKSLPPVFFDLDDVEHVVLGRYIKNRHNLRSKLLRLLLPSLTRGEYQAIKLASRTFVCSSRDRDYLSDKFHLSGIVAIPNAVSIPVLYPITSEQTLLYLSSDYGPNLATAEFLVKEIWPRIKQELPLAKLVLAGISADKFNFNVAGIPGLECPGFVENLDVLYKSVRATAVPILVGGGTRFKIIEAAVYGRPTVSTTIGAEGIELSSESEILIRDNPAEFAEACARLLDDSNYCEKIGLAARKKAIELYDRDNVIVTIRREIMDVIQAGQSQTLSKRNI